MYRELKERAEGCREDLAVFTEMLVQTPSYSFREEAVAEIVQDFLGELRYDLVFRDEVGNVVGLLAGGEEGPTVLLNSHMDTRRPEEGRTAQGGSPPGRAERGRVWGLGAADCKGGLASQVFAGHILDNSLPPLYGTLVFAATVAQDEGNGAGVRHLIEHTLPTLGVMPDLAILGEPTALVVYNGHDGRADVDVRITGRDLPATRRGVELIEQTLASACADAAWKSKRSSLHVSPPVFRESEGSYEATLRVRCRVKAAEAVANCVGLVKRMTLSAVAPLDDISVVVAVHSERRRFYTGETVEVLCWNNPWVSDPSSPLFRRALDALAAAGWGDVATRTWGFRNRGLVTAGGLLADGYHIPTLCFGPGDETSVHTPEESVDVERLVDAVFGTAVLAHGAIGAPSTLVPPAGRPPGGTGESAGNEER